MNTTLKILRDRTYDRNSGLIRARYDFDDLVDLLLVQHLIFGRGTLSITLEIGLQ
jgi:hypothetical protein